MSKEKLNHTGYLNSVSSVFANNKLLKIILAMMLVFQVLQFKNTRDMQSNWAQTIIPPCGMEPYKITRSTASENYLIDMSHYVVALWGNVSPTTVDEKFDILLTLFDEKSFPKYRDRLNELRLEIKKYSTISHGMDLDYPEPIRIIDNHLSIKVKRYRVVGTTLKPPTNGSLEIDFRIDGGRFKIIEMEEKQ